MKLNAVFTQTQGQLAKEQSFILHMAIKITTIDCPDNLDTLGSHSYTGTLRIHYLTRSSPSYVKLS